jgi:putative SOS response-associated peptidase YedK
MCGRYASSANPDDLVEVFEVDEVDEAVAAHPRDYNVAPTKQVLAVLERRHRDDAGEPVGDPTRRLRTARWGLVPSWAKEVSIGSRLINARGDTLAAKPAFRRAFARRRCLLPADGYYEWRAPGLDSPVRTKQPFYFSRADGTGLAMAGLYEIWHQPDLPADDPAGWLWTVTVVTTDAGPDAIGVHDRMPVLLAAADVAEWLDPDNADTESLSRLLVPCPAGTLQAIPVSTAVNDVRHNGAGRTRDEMPASQRACHRGR